MRSLDKKSPSISAKERGVALVALVFMLGLAFTAYMLAAYRPLNIEAERNKQTAQALMEAKTALVGWSVKNDVAPGRLPCPEDTSKIGTDQEGQAASSCTLPAIGRLPFRTLGIGDLRDGNKDQLWYVISGGFRDAPINSETTAQLTVDGVQNSAVAIVFSSGTPLGGQQRSIPTAVSPPDITDYLDLTNGDGDNIFITTNDSAEFNDRLLVISHRDLFTPVEIRVLRDAKSCLDEYAASSNQKYPWAAPLTDTTTYSGVPNITFGRIPRLIDVSGVNPAGNPTTSDHDMQTTWGVDCVYNTTGTYWHTNNWHNLVFYQLALGYQPQLTGSPSCGSTCLSITGSGNPNTGSGNYRAVLAIAREPIGTQLRSNANITANYLEGINGHSSINPSLFFETHKVRDTQYLTVNDLVTCIDGNNNCK